MLLESSDDHFMRMALREADKAWRAGEVPIGAVITHRNVVIAKGYNQTEMLQDPTAHAEMIAITAAAEHLGSRRLLDCILYVTLEPCCMCSGAIVLARLPRIVFGARDPKAGGCKSLYTITEDARLNHRCDVQEGVLAAECGDILRAFFAELRADKSHSQKNTAGKSSSFIPKNGKGSAGNGQLGNGSDAGWH